MEPLRVGYLWPSIEYDSEAGLRWMASYLDSSYGTRSFFFAGKDEYQNSTVGNPTLIPNIAELDSLDVLVIYVRRMWLGEPHLQKLKDFLASGKGLVGLRTASHAIESWSSGRGIDSVVWGGAYQDPGAKTGYRLTLTDSGRTHPVFDGVQPWPAAGALYWQNLPGRAMAPDITVHMMGEDPAGKYYPTAWTRVLNGGNVFYASPGTQEDFLDANFRRMVTRAVLWAGNRLPARPPAPVPSLPAHAATGVSLIPLLAWNASAGATSYRVQLGTDVAFSALVLDDSALSSTSRYAPPLSPGREYLWRVRASNAGGTSAYTSPWRFTTLPIPDTARALAPVSGAMISGDSAVLRWTRGGPAAAGYRLEISADSIFASRSEDSSLVDTFKVVHALAPGPYWWRVRACNGSGCGALSAPSRFTVSGSVALAPFSSPQVKGFGLERRWVAFELLQSTPIRVRLFDYRGRSLTLYDEILVAGLHRLPLPPPAGDFHMLEFRAGDFRAYRKLAP